MWVIALILYLAWVCFLIATVDAYAHSAALDLSHWREFTWPWRLLTIVVDGVLLVVAIGLVGFTIKVGYQIILKLHF